MWHKINRQIEIQHKKMLKRVALEAYKWASEDRLDKNYISHGKHGSLTDSNISNRIRKRFNKFITIFR